MSKENLIAIMSALALTCSFCDVYSLSYEKCGKCPVRSLRGSVLVMINNCTDVLSEKEKQYMANDVNLKTENATLYGKSVSK